ncbi:hypothetical protein B0H11DRAFT_1917641 [Mycena galericulata]|nr:hypothetical protein B0H11DRAFT_1917641 [Mycena galericulata]
MPSSEQLAQPLHFQHTPSSCEELARSTPSQARHELAHSLQLYSLTPPTGRRIQELISATQDEWRMPAQRASRRQEAAGVQIPKFRFQRELVSIRVEERRNNSGVEVLRGVLAMEDVEMGDVDLACSTGGVNVRRISDIGYTTASAWSEDASKAARGQRSWTETMTTRRSLRAERRCNVKNERLPAVGVRQIYVDAESDIGVPESEGPFPPHAKMNGGCRPRERRGEPRSKKDPSAEHHSRNLKHSERMALAVLHLSSNIRARSRRGFIHRRRRRPITMSILRSTRRISNKVPAPFGKTIAKLRDQVRVPDNDQAPGAEGGTCEIGFRAPSRRARSGGRSDASASGASNCDNGRQGGQWAAGLTMGGGKVDNGPPTPTKTLTMGLSTTTMAKRQ